MMDDDDTEGGDASSRVLPPVTIGSMHSLVSSTAGTESFSTNSDSNEENNMKNGSSSSLDNVELHCNDQIGMELEDDDYVLLGANTGRATSCDQQAAAAAISSPTPNQMLKAYGRFSRSTMNEFVHFNNNNSWLANAPARIEINDCPPYQSLLQDSTPLDHYWWRLTFCSTGICVCYLWYGILQEHLYVKSVGPDPNDQAQKSESLLVAFWNSRSAQWLGPIWIVLTQCWTNTAVAFVWQHVGSRMTSQGTKNNTKARTAASTTRSTSLPHRLLFVTACVYTSAMASSNLAIPYVSYPVAVLAKSCKLIPLLLVGRILEGKRSIGTQHQQWWAASCICSGIVLFHLGDTLHASLRELLMSRFYSKDRTDNDGHNVHESLTYTKYHWVGMLLLLLSLSLDGILGTCQNWLKYPTQRQQHRHQSSSSTTVATQPCTVRPPDAMETMLYLNLYGSLWLSVIVSVLMVMALIQTSLQATRPSVGSVAFQVLDSIIKPRNAVSSLSRSSWTTNVVILNGAAAFGQIFIYLTIAWFSPIMTTTLTTTRKFLTILVSVWYYGHSFTHLQWTAIAVVFLGLYMSILVQQQHLRDVTSNASNKQVAPKDKHA